MLPANLASDKFSFTQARAQGCILYLRQIILQYPLSLPSSRTSIQQLISTISGSLLLILIFFKLHPLMRFVSFSYVSSNEFKEPASWLKRIDPYLRVLEALAMRHEVHSIEQIDYEGKLEKNGVHYYFVRQRMRKFPISLHRLIRQILPDVIIVHGLNFPFQVIQLRQYVGKRPKILLQ